MIGPEYDAAGNVTTRDGRARYTYDSLNMLSHYGDASDRRILYDADDERIGTIIDSLSRWTIRDLDGQILREYRGDDLGMKMLWFREQDHIRGEGQLLGGETQQWGYNRGYTTSTAYVRFGGERHYHLDHLGSVRMVTNKQGRSLSEHDYYPFGTTQTKTYQEATNWADPHVDGMRFAGHWRDYVGYVDVEGNDYIDNMHARNYDPAVGRFLTVDPILGTPERPQSWNRYSYVQNNPVRATDPTGMKMEDCVTKKDGSMECTVIADDPFRDSVRLFANWVLERDEERLTYGPDDYQTMQMRRTRGVEAIRQAYKDRGCTSSTAEGRLYPESEGPMDAAIETFFDGNYLFNTTQAQVGGFSARVDNLGDGRMMYTVANALTVNSFFYHIPNAVGLRSLGQKSRGGTVPLMGRVSQTFRWTEKTPKYCP